MPEPRKSGAYRFIEILVKPWVALAAKRDWRGTANLPARGGVIVVSNHLSHFDPFSLGHFLNDNGRIPRFLGKDAIFEMPVVGRLFAAAGQIPVHRGSDDAASALSSAIAALADGELVVVYPEGSLTRDPDLWPMRGKTGAARLALLSGAPVVPVAQWGPQQVLAPYSHRPHLVPRRTVTLSAGGPVALDDLLGRPIDGALLKEATDRIMAALTAGVEQLRGETAPVVRFDPRQAGISEFGRPRPTGMERGQAS